MTHWIQPLDNVVLANWKRVIKNQVRHQARSFLLHRHYPKAVVQSVLPKAEAEAFTKEVIIAAFRNTGIHPFDSNVILERARENLAQPESEPLQTEQSRLVQELSNIPKELLNLNTPILKSKKGKVKKKNKLYTAEELIEFDRQEKEKEEQLQKEKEKKKIDKEKRRQEREETRKTNVQSHKRRREEKGNGDQQTSATTESTICQTCGRKYHGGINWWTCDNCGIYRLCEECVEDDNTLNNHVIECSEK
jgi:hypothetical protein